MDLGPFFVDLKGVPLYVEDQDVLRVMQVFEDDGFAPRGLVAASSLKGTMAKNSQDRQPALITRIYPLPSHSYECEPNTKVLRTVWSTRREPNALSVVSAVELDGKQLTLCRFGKDACTICFSLTHRTSGHERAMAKAAIAMERRMALRRSRLKHKEEARQRSLKRTSAVRGSTTTTTTTTTKTKKGQSEGGAKQRRSSEAEQDVDDEPPVQGLPVDRRAVLPVHSTLAPLLVEHYPPLSRRVVHHAFNASANTQSVVDHLSHVNLKHGDGTDRGGRGNGVKAQRLVEAASAAAAATGQHESGGEPRLSLESILHGGDQMGSSSTVTAGQKRGSNGKGSSCGGTKGRGGGTRRGGNNDSGGGGSGGAGGGGGGLAQAVSPEFRGKLASRGMHKMPTLTALELGNGLDTSKPGGLRFEDLSRHSALASTLLNQKLLLADSKHLEPSAGASFRAYATKLLSRQYDDFDLKEEKLLEKT